MSQQALLIAVASLNGQGFNFHSALQSFQPLWPTHACTRAHARMWPTRACARAHARKKNSTRSHSLPFQTLWPSLACLLLSEISFSLTHLSSRLHPSYWFKPWGKISAWIVPQPRSLHLRWIVDLAKRKACSIEVFTKNLFDLEAGGKGDCLLPSPRAR